MSRHWRESEFHCEWNQLGAVGNLHLAENMADVGLYGLFADMELFGNLPVLESLRDQDDDLLLLAADLFDMFGPGSGFRVVQQGLQLGVVDPDLAGVDDRQSFEEERDVGVGGDDTVKFVGEEDTDNLVFLQAAVEQDHLGGWPAGEEFRFKVRGVSQDQFGLKTVHCRGINRCDGLKAVGVARKHLRERFAENQIAQIDENLHGVTCRSMDK